MEGDKVYRQSLGPGLASRVDRSDRDSRFLINVHAVSDFQVLHKDQFVSRFNFHPNSDIFTN